MNTLTRWARHLWLDATDARRTLTPAGLQRLEQAVKDSESRHLGELRLCVEAGLPLTDLWRGMTPRSRAIDLFSQLRVWDTEHNNGVLIYLLLADKRIEVLADRGLHARTSASEWQAIAGSLSAALQGGQFEQGLIVAIEQVSALLKQHYPNTAHQARPNELPDAVALI